MGITDTHIVSRLRHQAHPRMNHSGCISGTNLRFPYVVNIDEGEIGIECGLGDGGMAVNLEESGRLDSNLPWKNPGKM